MTPTRATSPKPRRRRERKGLVAVVALAAASGLVAAHFGPTFGFEIRLLPLTERGVPARQASSLAPEDDPTVVEALNVLGGRVIDIKEIHE